MRDPETTRQAVERLEAVHKRHAERRRAEFRAVALRRQRHAAALLARRTF